VLNLPNLLTLERIVAAPIVMVLLAIESRGAAWAAAAFFVASALTDLVDGMLARRWNQVSLLGKFLDPLADKILVLGTLLVLLDLGRISPWLVFIILGREIAVGTLRTIAMGEGVVIAARNLGKQKTAFQMSGLVALILGESIAVGGITIDLRVVGAILLWIGAGLALVSAVDYVMGFLRGRRDGSGASADGTG
jgi:CDP-diacylglycerol--glycerol-3-phosphate 3-phosphatidyltransferase